VAALTAPAPRPALPCPGSPLQHPLPIGNTPRPLPRSNPRNPLAPCPHPTPQRGEVTAATGPASGLFPSRIGRILPLGHCKGATCPSGLCHAGFGVAREVRLISPGSLVRFQPSAPPGSTTPPSPSNAHRHYVGCSTQKSPKVLGPGPILACWYHARTEQWSSANYRNR
jgi:hypothetical protein